MHRCPVRQGSYAAQFEHGFYTNQWNYLGLVKCLMTDLIDKYQRC